MSKKIFRTVPGLCTGCLQCQMVCSLHSTGRINIGLARIRVTRSNETGESIPHICRHCKVPLCKEACPIPSAMTRDEATGAVAINQAECIGCLACMEACPFNAIWVGPNDEVLKCDLCDGDPMCVKHCRPRPDHQFPSLPYPKASALEYVTPDKITRKQPLSASKAS